MFRQFSLNFCLPLLLGLGSTWALAEEEPTEKVTVIGTRSLERSASDLAVPVDILDASELIRQGESNMDAMLSRIVPSLNVSQEPISDAATLVRPVNMRGLSPDLTLVLVNGKRRHRSSVITFLVAGGSEGSHAADLSSIPAIALDRVEVLRDGAAAQYGSDAVAGILNFVLKDANQGASVEARWGRYYKSDGENIRISGNVGLPLTEHGFLNISGEFNEADPTSRSVQRADAQALVDAGNTHVRTPAAQIWGAPEVDDNYKLFANAGIDLGDSHEAYAFGSYAERTVEGGFYFRNPHRRGGVFVDGNEDPLVIDHTGAGGCGLGLAKTDDGVDADDLAAIDSDPNCYAFNLLFPGGFTPQFGGDIEDESIAIGFRGRLPGELTYDVSAVLGRHQVDFFMKNTINPQLASLENRIPTEYNPGGYAEEDLTINLDLIRMFDVEAFHSPLNVGFGAEWREEEYEIKSGDMNSWLIDYIDLMGRDVEEPDLAAISCAEYTDFLAQDHKLKYPNLGIGSNGFPGFRPDPCAAAKQDRSSVAVYADLEADVTRDILLGLAVRHEDPEEFDSTLDGKFSARMQVTHALALRGSLSTGFRVPTVGQANVRNVTTTLVEGRLSDELTVPPTAPFLKGIAEPLEAEESVSVGLGAIFAAGNLDVTVDYYHIEVKDRISLTSSEFLDCLLLQRENLLPREADGSFEECKSDTAAALGFSGRIAGIREALRPAVPAIDSVAQVRYFANDFDTTTEGIDLVATYPAALLGGSTLLTLAANWNQTTIDKFNLNTINSRTRHQIEEGRPKVRWSLTADHQIGSWQVLGRVRYYGTHVDYHAFADELFQRTDARFLTDLEVGYSFTDQFALVVGADNLLDEDSTRNRYATAFGAEYPESVPFDANGGFYYLKAVANF